MHAHGGERAPARHDPKALNVHDHVMSMTYLKAFFLERLGAFKRFGYLLVRGISVKSLRFDVHRPMVCVCGTLVAYTVVAREAFGHGAGSVRSRP